MGDDDLAKKHLARLDTALEELEKTEKLAEEVAEKLIKDRQLAVDILEEA